MAQRGVGFWQVCSTLASLLFGLLVGTLRLTLFVARFPADALWAMRALRNARSRPLPPSPLEQLAPLVYRAPGLEADSVAPVVFAFTGTGETVEAAYRGVRRLCSGVEALAQAAVYVFEAPDNVGAYYGPAQFAARMWDAIGPVVARQTGPFILMGFSRGALVALDAAMRIVEEQAKVAGVLALSAPLEVPTKLPFHVRAIGGFEGVTEHLRASTLRAPAWARRAVEKQVFLVQVMLTAMVLKHLRVIDPHELAVAIRDIKERGSFASAVRATREFRLLLEIRARERELFLHSLARCATESARLFASFVWGEDDRWVVSAACENRVKSLVTCTKAAGEHVTTLRVPAQGHSLFRAAGAPADTAAKQLAAVVEETFARARRTEARIRMGVELEQKVRASSNLETKP